MIGSAQWDSRDSCTARENSRGRLRGPALPRLGDHGTRRSAACHVILPAPLGQGVGAKGGGTVTEGLRVHRIGGGMSSTTPSKPGQPKLGDVQEAFIAAYGRPTNST